MHTLHRVFLFVTSLQVWDGVSDARIAFSAADLPLGPPEISRMTENLNLQRGLLSHLSKIPEVQLLDNVQVTAIEKADGLNGWPLVRLSNDQAFRTRLLVSFVVRTIYTGSDLLLGWRGWAKLSRSCLCGNYHSWMGLRHPRYGRHPLACSSCTLPTPKYHRLSTFLTHRTDRLPSPLPNRTDNGLVDQTCVGRRTEVCGSLCTREFHQRRFPFARGFCSLSA